MEALSERRSLSEIFPGKVTSEHDPTEIWLRLRPSPVIWRVEKYLML